MLLTIYQRREGGGGILLFFFCADSVGVGVGVGVGFSATLSSLLIILWTSDWIIIKITLIYKWDIAKNCLDFDGFDLNFKVTFIEKLTILWKHKYKVEMADFSLPANWDGCFDDMESWTLSWMCIQVLRQVYSLGRISAEKKTVLIIYLSFDVINSLCLAFHKRGIGKQWPRSDAHTHSP